MLLLPKAFDERNNFLNNLGTAVSAKTYANSGNPSVVAMLDDDCFKVLDVGCGSGDNARLSARLGFRREFYGITLSAEECRAASDVMTKCWVQDVETSLFEFMEGATFDAMLFSHVLEHMKEPWLVISKLLPFLRRGGKVLIAVPNVLVWRQRLQFILGRFQYDEAGTMDNTHLRFFTYHSADSYLVNVNPNLRLIEKKVEGSVPLWFLRRRFLTGNIRDWCDSVGCQILPNLFGDQILLKAERIN